jgi:hypothetical protein
MTPSSQTNVFKSRFLAALAPRAFAPYFSAKKSISPMLYEIRNAATSELKGCLVGAIHDLSAFKISLESAPGFFGVDSEVRKCFEGASIFASEKQIPNHLMREDLIRQVNGVDFIYGFEAFKRGKKTEALEPGESPKMKDSSEDVFFQALKCKEALHETVMTGSEKPFNWRYQNCYTSPQRLWMEERNRTIARNADRLLRQPGSSFLAPGMDHLPGEQGVCNLLRKQGWDVRRVSL